MITPETKYVRVTDWGKCCSTNTTWFNNCSTWLYTDWIARYAFGKPYGDKARREPEVVYAVLFSRDGLALITEAQYKNAPTFLVYHEGLEEAKVPKNPHEYSWILDPQDPAVEEDAIYRMVWKRHVAEDVRVFAEDNGKVVTPEIVDTVAQRYVYEGDYDCNLSYWQNIENLLTEVIEQEK